MLSKAYVRSGLDQLRLPRKSYDRSVFRLAVELPKRLCQSLARRGLRRTLSDVNTVLSGLSGIKLARAKGGSAR